MIYKNDLKNIHPSQGSLWMKKSALSVLIVLILILFSGASFAAGPGRYEVVSGSNENAYLVDTTSGQVWILTYRSLATGREPIAIPYKFIKISPQNQKEFLVETIQQPALSDMKGKD